MISTMVDYGERLKQAMEVAGVDTTRLAKELRVSYQAVKKVLDGKSSALTAENNALAARFLKIDPDWLALGVGDMQRQISEGPKGYGNEWAMYGSTDERATASVVRTELSLKQSLDLVVEALQASDDLTLEQARPLFDRMVKDPSRGPEIAIRLEDLLKKYLPTEQTQRRAA